jgi:GNAT superfamily N-acetyltransferase
MNIKGPLREVRDECEQILRSLPGWFGIETALVKYAEATERLPTFAAVVHDKVVGFITLERHSQEEWEVHCIAVQDDLRGKGAGSALIRHAESWLGTKGARVLLVKTIADSHPSPEYKESRAFYSSQGFIPDQIIPDIWGPSNPCLQMRKQIAPL